MPLEALHGTQRSRDPVGTPRMPAADQWHPELPDLVNPQARMASWEDDNGSQWAGEQAQPTLGLPIVGFPSCSSNEPLYLLRGSVRY